MDVDVSIWVWLLALLEGVHLLTQVTLLDKSLDLSGSLLAPVLLALLTLFLTLTGCLGLAEFTLTPLSLASLLAVAAGLLLGEFGRALPCGSRFGPPT